MRIRKPFSLFLVTTKTHGAILHVSYYAPDGRRHYEPEIAYLSESTGPKAGFEAIWGRDLTGKTALWAEGLLQAWHRHWNIVAQRASVQWTGRPYAPGDLENALCIYQHKAKGVVC